MNTIIRCALFLSAASFCGFAQTVATIAGTDAAGFSGDAGPAAQATLATPNWIQADAAGNIFFVDFGNRRVRKIDGSGTISTVAGSGQPGFDLTGGPATQVPLSNPGGVAVAADGTLYIVDGFLKIVDPSGNLTPDLTVGLLAVAVDGNGTVYFAQSGAVYRREANGAPATLLAGTLGQPGDDGDGGPATQAHFSIGTGGLAADKMGNLYISDFQAGRVRMFTPGGLITTVAGNGSQGFAGDDGPAAQAQISPAGIAFDAAGNLYIAEPVNQRVRRVDTSGTITTFISNIGVTSLAVSPSGDVYGTAGNRIVTVKQ